MIILGIDPGIARVGWAIVKDTSAALQALNFGLFETSAKNSEQTRLEKIYEFVGEIINKFSPDSLAIEELFFSANSKTALVVGQARGVIILAASQAKIPALSFTPLQVKQALTGYGRADKKQIQIMVKSILALPEPIAQDDTADALAVAITLAFSRKMNHLTKGVAL